MGLYGHLRIKWSFINPCIKCINLNKLMCCYIDKMYGKGKYIQNICENQFIFTVRSK